MSGYGQYGYGDYGYKCEEKDSTPLHYYALRKIYPLDLMGTQDDQDTTVTGQELDNNYYSSQDLFTEVFPDTAYLLLPDWMRVCGTASASDLSPYILNTTPAQQIANILYIIRLSTYGAIVDLDGKLLWKKNRLSEAFYMTFASYLGYTASFTYSVEFVIGDPANPPFATPTLLPGKVYGQGVGDYFTITANVPNTLNSKGANYRFIWKALIEKLKPAWCEVTYLYS